MSYASGTRLLVRESLTASHVMKQACGGRPSFHRTVILYMHSSSRSGLNRVTRLVPVEGGKTREALLPMHSKRVSCGLSTPALVNQRSSWRGLILFKSRTTHSMFLLISVSVRVVYRSLM